MTASSQVFQPQIVNKLNAMPQSLNVTRLLNKNKAPVNPSEPVFLDLMVWASEHHYQNKSLGEDELGLVARAALQDPEGVFEALMTPAIAEAQTLESAAGMLLARLSDLIDDRSLPTLPA